MSNIISIVTSERRNSHVMTAVTSLILLSPVRTSKCARMLTGMSWRPGPEAVTLPRLRMSTVKGLSVEEKDSKDERLCLCFKCPQFNKKLRSHTIQHEHSDSDNLKH